MIKAGRVHGDLLPTMLAGGGSAEAIVALQSAHRSRNLLLLRALLDMVERQAPEDGTVALFLNNFDTLCALESAAPRQVAGILTHPHFGAWAATCLRLIMGDVTYAHPLWVDLGHLGALAIAAAIAADAAAEAAVPSRSGRVMIPGSGSILVGDSPQWQMTAVQRLSDGTLVVRRRDNQVTVPYDQSADCPAWQGIRHLRTSCAGMRVELDLDDLDPYRDPDELGAAERLTDEDYGQWQRQFAAAWAVLARRHREDATAVASTLRSVIPLPTRGPASGLSATSRYSPGAVSMTPQADSTRFASTLVHELQHTKLSLLMDSVPIYEDATDQLFYSPWRDDPRPLVGLIHGVYAGLAVAGFWKIERDGPTDGELAEFELVRVRRQVDIGLRTLAHCGWLTSAGVRLVAAIQVPVTSWKGERLQSHPAMLADDLVFDHSARWRLRNLAVADGDLAKLTAAWHDGAKPPDSLGTTLRAGYRESFAEDMRLRLAYRVLAGDGFTAGAENCTAGSGPAATADVRLINGDYAAAATAYIRQITTETPSTESWAGLAVAHRRLLKPGSDALVKRPDLVRAAYERLFAKSSPRPSPLTIAEWLAPVCANDNG